MWKFRRNDYFTKISRRFGMLIKIQIRNAGTFSRYLVVYKTTFNNLGPFSKEPTISEAGLKRKMTVKISILFLSTLCLVSGSIDSSDISDYVANYGDGSDSKSSESSEEIDRTSIDRIVESTIGTTTEANEVNI